ncbi:hypothetical protein BT63DRAFT_419580, partial [Microthyrium microscopicum]
MAQRRLEQEAAAASNPSHGTFDESPDSIEDVERLVDEDEDDDDDDVVDNLDPAEVAEFFGSDDSVEGEDVGIVMKKFDRGWTPGGTEREAGKAEAARV